ncbi:MFS transporter [Enterobacteriaceae bacterium ESL0689]|nr:MFS transporter [Enterobacteriaceae bacterium ESL0689]
MKKIIKLRWYIVFTILIGTILNYLARSSLSVAAPTLTEEFALTTEQYSYIIASFQAAYTIAQPLAGMVIDLIGVRVGFFIFAFGWGISCLLHAFATSWPALATFRGMLGLSEAAIFPASIKSVSSWFPRKERSIAIGWVNFGTSIGAMIAAPVMVFFIINYHWQYGFLFIGGLAVCWALAWLYFYRDPEKNKWLTDAELKYIMQDRAENDPVHNGKPITLGRLFAKRNFWGIAIPRFLSEPAWQTFNFWIPIYLVTVRHMDLKEVAMFGWLPFLAADLGSISGGYLAPLFRNYFKLGTSASYKLTLACGALFMVGPACIGLAANVYVAIALFCIGGFAHQIISTSLFALTSDSFAEKDVGKATGGAGMMGYLGGTIFSLIVGSLATTIGYNPLFVCLTIFDVLAAIVAWKTLKPVIKQARNNA